MTETPSSSTQKSLPNRMFKVFLAVAALECATAFIFMLLIPSDSKNALLFGFSFQRLLLLAIAAVAAATFTFLIFHVPKIFNQTLISSSWKQNSLFGISVALSAVAWQLVFIPRDTLGVNLAYYERLEPLLILFLIIFLEFSGLLLAFKLIATRQEKKPHAHFSEGLAWPFFFSLSGFLFFWLIVIMTGLGIGAGNNYWNKVGVPILGIQVLIVIAVGLAAVFLTRVPKINDFLNGKSWQVDLALVVVIWATTAIIWNLVPMANSRFNSLVLPPNYASYPFSDAQEYDLNAQQILQGKGISYAFTDKAFHITFLSILHAIVGQDFNLVLTLQIILLAFMPCLVFLLGKTLFNRSFGLMAAGIDIFYEINSIQATNLIQVSNVKMMMSEPLTRIGILAICLFAARWLKDEKFGWPRLAITAGFVGLVSLIRLNAGAILIAVMLCLAVQLKWQYRKIVMGGIVVVICFSAALAPWTIRNSVVKGNPLIFLESKLGGVIWRNRLSPMMGSSPTSIPSSAPIASLTPAPDNPISELDEEKPGGLTALVEPVIANFAHNLITSLLMIPPVWEQGNLLHLIREPYWDNEWDGTFTPGGQLLFLINMIIMSIGISFAWKRSRMAGIFPLLVFLIYQATNAVSVVSGGRYIVPVDWVLPFYYMWGLSEIIFCYIRTFMGWEIHPNILIAHSPSQTGFQWKTFASILVCLILGGSLPWIMESVFPEKYPQRSTDAIYKSLLAIGNLNKAGLSSTEINKFLMNPQAVLLEGQAFYPRFFQAGEGDSASMTSVFGTKAYPHFGFVLQGRTKHGVDLYLEEAPLKFENGTDVFVLGCVGNNKEIQGAMVLDTREKQVLLRSDFKKLTCPPGGSN